MLRKLAFMVITMLMITSSLHAQKFDPNSGSMQTLSVGGSIGGDASANGQSLTGLNLLGTISSNTTRIGYYIQAQDTSADCGGTGGNTGGLVVAFDDGTGANISVIILAYASAKGGQGGSIDSIGLPHTGRIRYYGTSGCQVGARAW